MIERLKQDPLREDSLDYYLFVIDTDKDVGNCYREICAEITGLIGDDQVGKDIAFLAEFYAHEAVERFKKIVTYVPDDRGCARPVRIFPSPFYGSDTFGNYARLTNENKGKFAFPAFCSLAIYLESAPDSGLLSLIKERANSVFENRRLNRLEPELTIEGFRLLEQHTVYKELGL